ncbi:MAG: ABC transporter permease, partial [Bacteroides sp.]
LIFRTVDNIRQSMAALKGSRLRTGLTMTIVAIGITALLGMLTMINAITSSIENDLGDQQGAAFQITSWSNSIRINNQETTVGEDYKYLSRREGEEFVQRYRQWGHAGVEMWITSTELRRGAYHTRPYLSVRGVTSGFLQVENPVVLKGRVFSEQEEQAAAPVTMVGEGIVTALFPNGEDPIGKRVLIGSSPFTIIGVLASKVQTFGRDTQNLIYVPLKSGLTQFPRADANCDISVKPYPGISVAQAMDEAERIMRTVRRLTPRQRSNFNIATNEEIMRAVLNSLSSTTTTGILIGLITLLGSAVALMNIMLASVTERTREIGVRKAIGAYAGTVRQQFLIEAVVVTVLGGLIGMVLGVVVGSLVAKGMGIGFAMPWGWVLVSLLLCVGVGVLAGYLPAKRAAGLDPILALRYE